jgi:predicted DNA-binding transcriptional regulator AlpA
MTKTKSAAISKKDKNQKTNVKAVPSSKSRMDTAEVAHFLDCSLPLVYAMLKDGRIKKSERIGKRLYLDTAEVTALKSSGTIHPRQKRNAPFLPSSIIKDQDKTVSFQVQCQQNHYHLLALILAPENMTVQTWVEKMISETVSNAQSSLNRVVSNAGA